RRRGHISRGWETAKELALMIGLGLALWGVGVGIGAAELDRALDLADFFFASMHTAMENDSWHYFPGGRNLTVLFVAWSTSSGVINTVIRDLTAPVALAANDRADASTLLGRSTMITKSSFPKA